MTPLAILLIAGAISAVGSVNLRGVPITRDGTIFSGDRIQVGPASYARLSVGKGIVLEAGAGADLTVTLADKKIRVHVAAGTVAFRDPSGKASYLTPAGVTSLDMGEPPPSTTPAGTLRPQSGRGKRTWIGIAGILGGTAAAAAVLISRNDDTDEGAAARLERTQFLSSLKPIAEGITITASNASEISATGIKAVSAIQAANTPSKASLLAQSAAVIAKANDAALKTTTLGAALSSLENTIALQQGGPTAALQQTVVQLINELNANRFAVNQAYLGLLDLLRRAADLGVPNLPVAPNIQSIPLPEPASPSAP
jgi:hypothetical protein